ncbi:hypothetical protein [Bacillus paranthracis]|uniref:hypothetical protein n=1 Tax=Bacillus paranthracis TaxID=2026186 RepID=UPI001D0D13D8|nr:hypothetical protein [Bacillus paranthracis]MBE7145325.1 hypothetical protein [Bacillus paranthracis]
MLVLSNTTINDIAIKLAMVLFIPLFLALLTKVILMRFIRQSIAGRLAYLACLFFIHYVFIFVTE